MKDQTSLKKPHQDQNLSCSSLMDFLTVQRLGLFLNGQRIAGQHPLTGISFVTETAEKIDYKRCQQDSSGDIHVNFQVTQKECVIDHYRDYLFPPGLGPHKITKKLSQVSCIFKRPAFEDLTTATERRINIQDSEGSCQREEISHEIKARYSR